MKYWKNIISNILYGAQDVAETGNMSHMMALNPLLKEGGMSDVRTDP